MMAQDDSRVVLLPPGQAHASDTEQHGGSLWGWIKSRASQCWLKCQACFGSTLEGLKDCCCGCFAGLCSCLKDCCGGLVTSCGGWCGPRCPPRKSFSLSKKVFADFLDTVATVGVMGILTLNIYCATYFMAWAKANSYCTTTTSMTWVKVIIVGLPFAMFPLTLYISAQARALQKDLRGLGLVAGSVILEILYILFVGAVMTVCMSGSDHNAVAAVTMILSLLLVIGWGCCCHYPKCLRTCCTWCCKRCCQIDEEAVGLAVGPSAVMANVELAAAALQEAAAAAVVVLKALAPVLVDEV